jgi:ammonia channel protein AmtB
VRVCALSGPTVQFHEASFGLRVTREQKVEGLGLALHDERAYNH